GALPVHDRSLPAAERHPHHPRLDGQRRLCAGLHAAHGRGPGPALSAGVQRQWRRHDDLSRHADRQEDRRRPQRADQPLGRPRLPRARALQRRAVVPAHDRRLVSHARLDRPPYGGVMQKLPVTLEDVEYAAARIGDAVVHTPCLRSETRSRIAKADVWVKFENLQFTASFKERGALNTLLQLTDEEKKRGVIAMSAGNHAQGVAYHAGRLGIPATIVMPSFTPNTKVEHTRGHGARVVLHGDTLAEAATEAHRLADADKLTFVHPYDDPRIIAGQGTIALEMLQDAPEIDTIVAPVGGGGMIAGCAVAARGLKPDLKMIGVETTSFSALHQLLAGEPVTAGGDTIAEGIAVRDIGKTPLAIAKALLDQVLTVDEVAIEHAIALFLEVEKTVAEGAGAACLAALLAHPQHFTGRKVGLVLSGGNIDT